MTGQGRWPKPVPGVCSACGSAELEGLGPAGHWDGAEGGGLIYAAQCQRCGTKWNGYGWGGPPHPEILAWERQIPAEPGALPERGM
jgi:hypothetical protein